MPQRANIAAFPAAAPKPSPVMMAPAADDSRRSFLRMVSHELRTPLNSIIGFSEILNQELCGPIGSPQYKDYAGLIGQSGHRLLKLVNQILEIVRLEDGAEDLDIRTEALEPIVEDAFKLTRAEAEARGVALRLDASAGLPDVVADPRAMQTVLVNLLQNAIAFSPPGGEVTVRARASARGVLIEVLDQGPGVAGEDLERILRPFEQCGDALTRSAEGAGLGLSIVRLLCEAMGGLLELKSQPGQGFTAAVSVAAA